MNKYSQKLKEDVIARCLSGESVLDVSKTTSISKSTIYEWLNPKEKSPKNEKENYEKIIKGLQNKINRLEGLLEIIRVSESSPSAPLKEKLYALEKFSGQYNVHMLCDALDVSRGTFYNHILRNKKTNTVYSERREIIKNAIQTVYDESRQIFGARKIAAVLRKRGFKTCEDTVRKLMHDMGLFSIRQRAKFLYEKERRIANKNILRQQFNPSAPNQIWVSDVTCFYFNEKNYYICAILDLFSRKVIGYKIGIKNSTQLTKSTFKCAYLNRMPGTELLFHTDNGSHYRSYAFCRYLKSLGVQQSFSRPHIPYDNSVMETFFSSMKREELYRTKYRSERELKKLLTIIYFSIMRKGPMQETHIKPQPKLKSSITTKLVKNGRKIYYFPILRNFPDPFNSAVFHFHYFSLSITFFNCSFFEAKTHPCPRCFCCSTVIAFSRDKYSTFACTIFPSYMSVP